jgi:hypothetical protein
MAATRVGTGLFRELVHDPLAGIFDRWLYPKPAANARRGAMAETPPTQFPIELFHSHSDSTS